MYLMAELPSGMVEAKEAAKTYNVSYHTIRTWIRRGKVYAEKQGRGRIAVRREDIETLLRFQPITPRSDERKRHDGQT